MSSAGLLCRDNLPLQQLGEDGEALVFTRRKTVAFCVCLKTFDRNDAEDKSKTYLHSKTARILLSLLELLEHTRLPSHINIAQWAAC